MIYHLVEYFDINKQLKMRNINFRLDLEIGPCLYLENFVVPSLYLSFICFAFACICFCLICMPASVSGFRTCVWGSLRLYLGLWDSGSDRWPALGELLCMAPTLSPTPHLTTLCPIVPRYPVPHHHYCYCYVC